jgi:hypothetical protein
MIMAYQVVAVIKILYILYIATAELVTITLFTVPDLAHASKTLLVPSTAGVRTSSSFSGGALGNGEAT